MAMMALGWIAVLTAGAFVLYQVFDNARYLTWLYKTEKAKFEHLTESLPE